MSLKVLRRRSSVLVMILMMLPVLIVPSVDAETISGVVHCLDPDLTVSVISGSNEFGPFPVENGEYSVELPAGVRSGKLVFHRFGRNPIAHTSDRDRPASELEGYHTNVTFEIPEGSGHLRLGERAYAIVTFDVKIPRGETLQIALFRDGWKNYGTRRMEFPANCRISYLVSPPASVQLKLLYEDSSGLALHQVESDTVDVVTWDAHYHAVVPRLE